jgi:DNA polymerase-3 subunit alpha
MPKPFVHLHVHSDFSLSTGASKVTDLVARAKAIGVPALALTDRDAMYGAYEFSKAASSAGVQPILGAKLHFATEGRADSKGKSALVAGSILLLAKDETGYRNLCRVLAAAHRPDGTGSDRAIIPPDVLGACSEGLIALTGGRDGFLSLLLSLGRKQEAQEYLHWLSATFGDRVYAEICRNGALSNRDAAIEEQILDLAYDLGAEIEGPDGIARNAMPLVASSEVHYATEDRHDAWEILNAVNAKKTVAMEGRTLLPSTPLRFHLRTAEEMEAMFSDLPEAVANAVEIGRRCAFMVTKRKPLLPPFETGAGRSENDELRHQAVEGLAMRLEKASIGGNRRSEYETRLDYELGVIQRMGFAGYFLIVSDFIKHAKGEGIPVGPGRGSGAGSIVAWALQITDLDPIEFGLLFERFLNPDRVSMPDFDIDFCQDGRSEVIRYVQERYGQERVSAIATFGEIKSKSALKDAGRVITHDRFGGYGFGEINDVTKAVPKKEGAQEPEELAKSYERSDEFRRIVDGKDKMRILYDNALKIEGLYRSQGSHAAGIVIGGQPLADLAPIGWDHEASMPICQFDLKSAEDVGLVKFDFLGLKTLSVIRMTLDLIQEFRGVEVDISSIPTDDQEVFQMLREGKSNGVFQFESGGMKRVLREVKPDRLSDLIAVNALYRPGPMEYISVYAECKNGLAEPNYAVPEAITKPILEETYGIMVYQEQVMQVAQAVAGYSLGGADLLRRAMGKKIKEEMDKQRQIFVFGDPGAKPPIPGATGKGVSEADANSLFDDIAKFASYGFNKSHAAAYAWIAYQTAYLKRKFPVEFFSALLSYETDKPERMALIRDDLVDFGIPLLPPDINRSRARFRPERHEKGHDGLAVRFGLTAIKGISGDMKGLEAARSSDPFSSLTDFHARAGGLFNKLQIEKLAEAGAFDCLTTNRYQAVSVLSWLSSNQKKAKPKATGDLFGAETENTLAVPVSVLEVPDWGNRIDREFKAVGFYFNSHPLDPYMPRLKRGGIKRRRMIMEKMVQNGWAQKEKMKLAGLVEKVDRQVSRRGNAYLTITLVEKDDSYRVMFFGSPDFPIEQARKLLEGAKASKKPVIMVADMALEGGGADVGIFGKQVWDIDDFLVGVRGSFVVTVDHGAVIPTITETAALSAEGADIVSVRQRMLNRKARELDSFFLTLKLPDGREDGVPVTLKFLSAAKGEVRRALAGRYQMTPATESSLKAMDGVVSITETF